MIAALLGRSAVMLSRVFAGVERIFMSRARLASNWTAGERLLNQAIADADVKITQATHFAATRFLRSLTVKPDAELARMLNHRMQLLANYTGREVSEIILQEAGLFQRDAVRSLPPRDRSQVLKKYEREVHKKRAKLIVDESFLKGKKFRISPGGFVWLVFTPRVVIGVHKDDLLLRQPVQTVLLDYRRRQHAREKARSEVVGMRGAQRFIVRRGMAISQRQHTAVVRTLQRSDGLLKASFAAGWNQLNPGRRLAAWISRHQTRALGTTRIRRGDLGSRVDFVSWAWGNAHPRAKAAVRIAFASRIRAIDYRILRGYRNAVRRAFAV